jgi:hypothetical protein
VSGIDAQQAAQALSEIDDIARRVRQSRRYRLASLMLVLWGALTFAGYCATWLWPRASVWIWTAVYAIGFAGSFAISALTDPRAGGRSFDLRTVLALVLYIGFGVLVTTVLGHFGPRQLSAFWPIYIMLVYVTLGLWVGNAFVAIGSGIIALTLIGYFFVGAWFELWMAVVNGGGLVLGGLWMRRD